jgi:hypothetical protein
VAKLTAAATVVSTIRSDLNQAGVTAIVTGSVEGSSGSEAGTDVGTAGFDVVAFHDGRSTDHTAWISETTISGDISQIRGNTAVPILYDEPTAWCESSCSSTGYDDNDASHFSTAARLVKKYGGALWTFHSRTGNDLSANNWETIANSNDESAVGDVRTATRGRPWGTSGIVSEAITQYVTTVKAAHFIELRRRIDDLRARFSASTYSWSNSMAAGTTIRRQDLIELRDALAGAYQAAAETAPTYTTASTSIVAGTTTIQAQHITELRTAVRTLEEKP